MKQNTLILYCGDNGTPPSAARTAMTLRGQKGNMYEGGVRVPGVLEWPAVIKEPATTSAISVTTDILPTLADSFPEIVEEMQTQLHNWQESVLNSLSRADYK